MRASDQAKAIQFGGAVLRRISESGDKLTSLVETSAGEIAIRADAVTDVGNVRAVNEDAVLAQSPIFLVADGMGGHSYGDRASQTVVETFAEAFADETLAEPEAVLGAIDVANQRIQELVNEADGPGAVAGTTLTGMALVDVAPADGESSAPHWMIYNVGDSRVYGWNGRDLVQITVDHSAVQELVALGIITPDEAEQHPDRNVITRAVGSEPSVETDLWLMPVQGHQLFLVCSDGLNKELVDADIAAIIREYLAESAPEVSLAQELVNEAISRGGRDNISVVIVESSVQAAEGVEAPPRQ